MIDGRILDYGHLTLTVKNQRVIVLRHKETLHAPRLFRHFRLFAKLRYGQRKLYARILQLAIGGKIENEIVKQFIGCLATR